MRNIVQKFKSINPLHKDMINAKVFETVGEQHCVVFIISILRCVICFFRRSRRIESSTIVKKGQLLILIELDRLLFEV